MSEAPRRLRRSPHAYDATDTGHPLPTDPTSERRGRSATDTGPPAPDRPDVQTTSRLTPRRRLSAEPRWLVLFEDEQILELAPEHNGASVDAGGASWFVDGGIPAHVLRLDDAGTPWTPGDDVWLAFRPPPELPDRGFDFLKVDPWGRKWLLSQTSYSFGRELVSFDDGGTLGDPSDDVWTHYGSDDALPKLTTVFVIDESSNLWLGTDTGLGYLHVEQ